MVLACGAYRRLDAEHGECRTIAEKLAEGGFTFPLNIMCIDGSGKGYLAVIGTEGAPPDH